MTPINTAASTFATTIPSWQVLTQPTTPPEVGATPAPATEPATSGAEPARPTGLRVGLSTTIVPAAAGFVLGGLFAGGRGAVVGATIAGIDSVGVAIGAGVMTSIAGPDTSAPASGAVGGAIGGGLLTGIGLAALGHGSMAVAGAIAGAISGAIMGAIGGSIAQKTAPVTTTIAPAVMPATPQPWRAAA
ncbi:MAG: hypothetical protein H7287_00565 [Thermoleophilia bacterium]|nr:hypothetical protein [Thermoleophilia bacterium]